MRTALGSSCHSISQTWQNIWLCIHRGRGDMRDHPAAAFLVLAQPSLESSWAGWAQGMLKLHPKTSVHINIEHPAASPWMMSHYPGH